MVELGSLLSCFSLLWPVDLTSNTTIKLGRGLTSGVSQGVNPWIEKPSTNLPDDIAAI